VLAPNQSGALNFAGSDVAHHQTRWRTVTRVQCAYAKGRQPRRIFVGPPFFEPGEVLDGGSAEDLLGTYHLDSLSDLC
jgi:hypothetical protein